MLCVILLFIHNQPARRESQWRGRVCDIPPGWYMYTEGSTRDASGKNYHQSCIGRWTWFCFCHSTDSERFCNFVVRSREGVVRSLSRRGFVLPIHFHIIKGFFFNPSSGLCKTNSFFSLPLWFPFPYCEKTFFISQKTLACDDGSASLFFPANLRPPLPPSRAHRWHRRVELRVRICLGDRSLLPDMEEVWRRRGRTIGLVSGWRWSRAATEPAPVGGGSSAPIGTLFSSPCDFHPVKTVVGTMGRAAEDDAIWKSPFPFRSRESGGRL